MNTNLKAKLLADINALDGSEELDALLVLAKACQPWLSEFTTQELAPLANLVNNYLASSASDANPENILIASKALQAIDIASQPTNSPIKNIYRGVYNGRYDDEATISIPAVNMDKTVVNMLSNVTATSAAIASEYANRWYKFGRISTVYAYLSSSTTLGVRNNVSVLKEDSSLSNLYRSGGYIAIHWEVIEYA